MAVLRERDGEHFRDSVFPQEKERNLTGKQEGRDSEGMRKKALEKESKERARKLKREMKRWEHAPFFP